MTKLLYCIRHGTALHNVNFDKMGRKAYTEFFDTPLVDLGKLEAVLLGTTWRDIDKVELILVSPLTRTLDTAKFIFQHHKAPVIALDYLMEHPQAEEICNLRASKDELSLRYPNVDFSNLTVILSIWNGKMRNQHAHFLLNTIPIKPMLELCIIFFSRVLPGS